jgi:hypothetical protein
MTKKQLNNNNYNDININSTSNIKPTNINKIYVDIINKFKQKENYFNLFNKNKQNKDLIRIKTISNNLNKTTNLKNSINKKQNLKSKLILNTNIIKNFIIKLSKINKSLVSNIKFNDLLIEKELNKFETLNLQKEKQIDINKDLQEQTNSELIKLNQEQEKKYNKKSKIIKEKKSILIKIINLPNMNINNNILSIKKNKVNQIIEQKNKNKLSKINKSLDLPIKDKILDNNNISLVNDTNKHKSSILLFIDNLKQQNFNSSNINQKNIRKYINSKTSFNSKIAKILTTTNNYNFNKYNQINKIIKNNIYEFLHKSFLSMFSLISKPVYIVTPDKIIIQLFYLILKKDYINNSSLSLIKKERKLQIICNILTRFFKKPIELDLVRLHYPYYNSNIFVNLFGIFINKIKLRKIVNKFINKVIKNQILNNFNINNNYLPSDLSGIKIKIAGRLLTQRIIPRKTTKFINNGALSRNKTILIETARFTNKNKRGAFTITISIGHKLKIS